MQIIVLDDGQTFGSLDGCEIVTVSDDLNWEDVNDAGDIPLEFIISRVVLRDITAHDYR
jgi:hypothetical protein